MTRLIAMLLPVSMLYLFSVPAVAQIPENDTCAGAIVFDCSDETINLQTDTTLATDDYDQDSACTGFNSLGPDIVYRIDILPGANVTFTLDTDATTGAGSGYDGSLYLITDCSNPSSSCLVGQDNDPTGLNFSETISYTNNGVSTLTTFLIVDAFFGISFPDRGQATLTGSVQCPVSVDAFTWGGVKKLYNE